jgi:hypothetical protein
MATTAPTDLVSLERTRFFPRQLVGPDDLTQDQLYFREKLRRHNRLLHGWGIVCGVLVTVVEKSVVEVTPGYVLGPYGDEILVTDDVRLDVAKQSSLVALDCVPADPWCADPPRLRDGEPGYLAIRHVERDTRPVRVPSCGCGCDESACEYSRIRDGFELAVLTELPATYRTMQKVPLDDVTSCKNGPRTCPPCPSDPWVILADVTVSGGTVDVVQPDPHRRYVASYADYWFDCAAD